MLDWLNQNSGALSFGASVVMTLIWFVYLQLILSSMLRQRRTAVLINTGIGVGIHARCFISNLGYEPIYLYDILVRLTSGGRTATAAITDRSELSNEPLNDLEEAMNQGPMNTGRMTDIGSFHDLFERARGQVEEDFVSERVERLELVVVATTASRRYVGACRAFALEYGADGVRMRPQTLDTHQLRSRRARRRLRRELEALRQG